MLQVPTQFQEKSVSKPSIKDQTGALVIPAIMWFAGVPFFVVLLLWLLFFRG